MIGHFTPRIICSFYLLRHSLNCKLPKSLKWDIKGLMTRMIQGAKFEGTKDIIKWLNLEEDIHNFLWSFLKS